MAASSVCLGREERVSRRNKTLKLLQGSPQALDEEKRILIKRGPVSAKTSLREIEIHYKSRPEWRVVEEGGVLSIPVEEFRMVKPSPKWTQAVQETMSPRESREDGHPCRMPTGMHPHQLFGLLA